MAVTSKLIVAPRTMISVIIPIYNVAKWLPKCLDSVSGQTFRDFEVLLIADDSSDDSCLLAEDYALHHSNTRVFRGKKRGLSEARNLGIQEAKGDFLFFLDGDDYLEPAALEKLSEAQKRSQADIVQCLFNWVNEDGTISAEDRRHPRPSSSLTCSGKEALGFVFVPENVYYVVTWTKLYRATLFQNIRFPLRQNHEDEVTTPKLFFAASSIVFIDDVLYHYVQRSGSLMKQEAVSFTTATVDAYLLRTAFWKQIGNFTFFATDWRLIVTNLNHFYVSCHQEPLFHETYKKCVCEIRKDRRLLRKAKLPRSQKLSLLCFASANWLYRWLWSLSQIKRNRKEKGA